MPDYDETTVALVGEILKALGADDPEAERSYEDELRAAQVALFDALNRGGEEAPAPEEEQAMRQALGRMDPKSGDAELDYGDILRRLLAAVDKELFKWTSSIVQPPGPSGEAQVALTEDTPIPEALRPA